jgi:hypothetical protein
MWEPSGIERKDSCFLSPALECRRQRSNVAFMRTRTIVLVVRFEANVLVRAMAF